MMTGFPIFAWANSEIEVVFVFFAVLIMYGAKRIPDFVRGLRRGVEEFRKASRGITDVIDESAWDAGRSTAGIHGRPAAEALTTENQTVEIYNSTAWENRQRVEPAAQTANGIWTSICRAATKWQVRFAIAGVALLILASVVIYFLSKHGAS
jgi:sec-independent protein translocase protein TatA